ncbi:MAG: DUF1573 domain-containing protein [Planctomycetota bacterium]|nr:DUF1573 domain-containing protein [Planctomycetota bacterium]
MTRLGFLLVLLILFPQLSYGQVLVAKPSTLELGKLGRGWSGDALWIITNNSGNPVKIIDVFASCHCVKPLAEKTLLGPGESTRIKATIRTLSQPGGKATWKVTLTHGTPAQPELLSLFAVADLIADLRIEPTILSFRGSGTHQTTIQIEDTRTPPIQILKATTSVMGVSATVMENLETTSQRIQKIAITKGAHAKGQGYLVLETTDNTRPRIEIPILIEESSTNKVEMTPSRMAWNEKQACRVVLSRPGDLLVRVARVDCPPGVSVEIHRGPGPRSTLLFTRMGSIPAGSKARVVFEKAELGVLDLEVD